MSLVVSTSWAGATPSPKNTLIETVCNLYGISEADTDLRQKAILFLDQTIKDLNTNLFEFNRVTEQGILFVAGQPFVTLSNQSYKTSQAYLRHNSKGDEVPLAELPWTHFKRLYFNDMTEGKPFVFSTFNEAEDQRMFLYYAPNQSVIDEFTLSVEYYVRVPLISTLGSSNSLSVPPEIENALVYGAQKRMAIHLKGAGDRDVASLAGLEEQALERLKKSDRTKPGQQLRFRLCDNAFAQRR